MVKVKKFKTRVPLGKKTAISLTLRQLLYPPWWGQHVPEENSNILMRINKQNIRTAWYEIAFVSSLPIWLIIWSHFHTWDTGGPDGSLPDTARHAGEVPCLLVPVAQEEDGWVGTGVGGVWEKGNRQPIPVRLQPCLRWGLIHRKTSHHLYALYMCKKMWMSEQNFYLIFWATLLRYIHTVPWSIF